MSFRALALLAASAVAAVAVLVGSGSATASRSMLIGFYDEQEALWQDNAEPSFETFQKLHAKVIRVNLYWSLVAKKKPARATDPSDPAYDWELYDRFVNLAKQYKIKPLLSIYGSPTWANGGKRPKYAPKSAAAFKAFAYAAAKRYSGTYTDDGMLLGPVRYWLVWNEPNNPTFFLPQYKKVRVRVAVRRHGRVRKVMRTVWRHESPRIYAKLCAAAYSGIHGTLLTGEKVGCGATAPRGGSGPRTKRPSLSPLTFLADLKRAGLRKFDAYAHHPYASRPSESPTTRIRSHNYVTYGNLSTLTRLLTKLYGKKHLWLTEYGYQTRPPDPIFGVSWTRQAQWLTKAFALARKNPRIDIMLWFLLRDEPRVVGGRDGWQSGLLTIDGKEKPAFTAFQRLPH